MDLIDAMAKDAKPSWDAYRAVQAASLEARARACDLAALAETLDPYAISEEQRAERVAHEKEQAAVFRATAAKYVAWTGVLPPTSENAA